jgi:hypothetical protein
MANYFKDWGWYPTIKKLAKDDIFAIDKVTQLSLHKCLLFLSCEVVENKAIISAQNKSKGKQITEL